MFLRRLPLLTTGLALAYYAAADLGLLLAIGPGRISAVWLAAGLALAALMVFGRRAAPGVTLGMLAANWVAFSSGQAGHGLASAAAAVALTAAELLQAALAARALFDFPARVRRSPVRQTLRFALTVLLCSLIACSAGELTLSVMGLSHPSDIFFGWITWLIGDVTGTLVLAPGLLLLMHPRLRDDRLAVQAFPLMCLGLGLTIFSTFAVGVVDRDAHIERFSADANRLAMTLQNHVELTGRDLETLQHYFYKVDLDATEFRAVSTPLLMRSPWQSTFEWLPRVEAAGRDAFESSPAGLNGMAIRDVDADGALVRARRRAVYYPVAWTDPEFGRETLVGIDHGADALRGAALQSALHTGAMAATPPLASAAYSPEERVVQTLYLPISDKSVGAGQAYDAARVRGVVAATMDLTGLFKASLDQMAIRDQTVLLYDPDAPGSAALQWSAGKPIQMVAPALRDRVVAELSNGIMRRHWLKVGDRRWGLLARPAWASTMPQPGWLLVAVLGSGLAFTALLTGFLVVRRRRDEVLQDAREQLEEQVHARTQDLAATNRRLVDEVAGHRRTESLLHDARRHAESANRAKSLFLANMSHEIRTPLNAVLGYTQLLIEDKRQSGESRERLRIIYSAGQRLLGLINDVLDLAKIEAGGIQVHAEPIDLRRELAEIGTLFQPRAQAKGLAWRVHVDLDGDRAFEADRAKFGQIVLNLLGNALKFTDRGGIVLHAWRDGSDTVVEVEDTGPGMDAAELEGAFSAFLQGAAGLDKGGTGLGLSLSRNLARALGGELSITSARGQGTRVRLRLPMAEVDAPAAPPQALRGARRLVPGSHCRVLVVEDDAHSRDVLTTLLRQAGCEVTEAVDGAAGLQACRAMPAQAPFAIVFSDIRMPRLDGLQMLHALRADERTRMLPLIAVSASSLEHERRYYVAQGFQDFVSKPYAFDAIYAMLAEHGHATLEPVPEEPVPEAATHAGLDPARAAEIQYPAIQAQLEALAQAAFDGAVGQVRQHVAALAAAGPQAVPPGLLAQMEADLRAYDYGALEARVRELLHAREGAPGESPALSDAGS